MVGIQLDAQLSVVTEGDHTSLGALFAETECSSKSFQEVLLVLVVVGDTTR